jgi:segregation and condensation protein A
MQRLLPFAEEDLVILKHPNVRDLLKTFSSLMSNLSEERIIDLYEEVSVNEKITLLNEFLDNRGECYFSDLLVRKGSLIEIVCAFLAVLEAAKVNMIIIAQTQVFGDILIKRRVDQSEDLEESKEKAYGGD